MVSVLVALSATLTGCNWFKPDPAKVAAELATLQAPTPTRPVRVVIVTKMVTSTPAPATATSAPSVPPTPRPTDVPVECGQARDLGPWAPDSFRNGETFEVTASKGDSAGVVLGLWWPNGNPDWGTKEVTTFVPPGLSVTVLSGAGRGWDYPQGCSEGEVARQMSDHMDQRAEDTNYHGFVLVDDLIEEGLVEVRFDRR